MCNLLSLSFSLYLSLPRSASQRRIDAVLWFPLTQFLSFKHTLTLPQHILMLNMRLNNLWQNITNTQGHVNATQKPHTHTHLKSIWVLEGTVCDVQMWNVKVGAYLILGYFLCCCIVTAPGDWEGDWERKTRKGKRKEKRKEREREQRWW